MFELYYFGGGVMVGLLGNKKYRDTLKLLFDKITASKKKKEEQIDTVKKVSEGL